MNTFFKFLFFFKFFIIFATFQILAKGNLSFIVQPYLQFVTTEGITVMAESSKRSLAILHYGETANCKQKVESKKIKKIHEIRIKGLKPDTQYFYYYQLICGETKVKSKVNTFQTAPLAGQPVTFAIISDTQGNPRVSVTLANFAWNQRPHFLLIPGDLVSTGSNKKHWLNHFFPSMK